MPKQGKFASSQRVRQVNDFHQKHPAYRQRTITGDQFDDFLLVRFALTTKKGCQLIAGKVYNGFYRNFRHE